MAFPMPQMTSLFHLAVAFLVTCEATVSIVNVVTFDEGLSSHRFALAEVLTLAHQLQAVFVEPSYCHGRLGTSCSGGVRLGSVFNLTRLRRWVRIEQEVPSSSVNLQNRSAHGSVRKVCLHSGNPADSCQHLNLTAIAGKSEAAVSALEHGEEAILEVHHYRRGSVRGLSSSVTHAITAALDFAEEQYDKVRQIMGLLGLPARGYIAFHWRSENHHAYEKCARDMLKSHAKLLQNRNSSSGEGPLALLVSDIQFNTSLRWGGMKELDKNSSGAAAQRALDLLFAHNFTKLDRALRQPGAPVPGDLAEASVWDLILAQQAGRMATCSGCHTEPCHSCAWQGNYARFVVDLRSQDHQQTFRCWP